MTTAIEWTDDTWNPVSGCTKVSPGCDHCYAERITNRFGGPGAFDTVVLHPDRLDKPLHWKKPRRVFVNSMSDLFHDDVPDDFIGHVFGVMSAARQHQFQVLTKRPGRMASLLASERIEAIVGDIDLWPLPNVWLGVSVENQKWADVRIPLLLNTPAAVRFLSCEPLLGPVELGGGYRDWLRGWDTESAHAEDESCRRGECRNCPVPEQVETPRVDWVIGGGESGPGARPCHPAWAESLRDQCVDAGVPWFWKQWGEWAPTANVAQEGTVRWVDLDGSSRPAHEALPAPGAQLMARVGKHAAGRALDGRTWDEMPAELVSA